MAVITCPGLGTGSTQVHGICTLEVRREGETRHLGEPGHRGVLQAGGVDRSTQTAQKKQEGQSEARCGLGGKQQPAEETWSPGQSPESRACARDFPASVLAPGRPVARSDLPAEAVCLPARKIGAGGSPGPAPRRSPLLLVLADALPDDLLDLRIVHLLKAGRLDALEARPQGHGHGLVSARGPCSAPLSCPQDEKRGRAEAWGWAGLQP